MHARVKENLIEFIHVIGAEIDDATRLLRLHGLAEYFLEIHIQFHVPKGTLITKDERFGFYHKLQIVSTLGVLDSQTIGALRKLGKVRNRCAHQRRPIVKVDEVVQIGYMLGQRFDKGLTDFKGENCEFRALAWALFCNLSDQITSKELSKLRIY